MTVRIYIDTNGCSDYNVKRQNKKRRPVVARTAILKCKLLIFKDYISILQVNFCKSSQETLCIYYYITYFEFYQVQSNLLAFRFCKIQKQKLTE